MLTPPRGVSLGRLLAVSVAATPLTTALPVPTAGQDIGLLVAAEELRIGGPGAVRTGHDLEEFGSVVVDSLGRVWVPQRQEGSIRVFSPNGELLFRVGRRGEGPGEFMGMGFVFLQGDRVWVLDDRRAWRATVFDLEGRLVETRSLVPAASSLGPGRALFLFGDRLLGRADRMEGWTATARTLHVLDWDGEVIRDLGRVPGYGPLNHLLVLEEDVASVRGPHLPFSEYVPPALARDGSAVAVVDQTGTASGDATTARVRVLRADRSSQVLEDRFELEWTPSPVTDDDRERALSPALDEIRSFPGYTPDWDRIYLDAATEAFHPPVNRVLLANDGTVWLRRERTDPAWDRWEVRDAEGRIHSTVRVPSTAVPLLADEDTLWARVHDDLRVPYLVRYRLDAGF